MSVYSLTTRMLLGANELVSSVQSVDSDDAEILRFTLGAGEDKTFTGGAKGTLIVTDTTAAQATKVEFGSTEYQVYMSAFLPGGVGSVTITNELQEDVELQVAVFN